MAQATLPAWIQTLRQRAPEFADGYMAQRERILRDGAIPAKYKHLMTMTDLRGVETHGVSNMLRAYVRDYRAGKLDPRPGWRLVRESLGTAVIDAERRLGIIVGPKAMRLAIDKARAVGVGIVTVYNSGHFGAIGHFAMQAAEQDMIGVCFTGASVSVVQIGRAACRERG